MVASVGTILIAPGDGDLQSYLAQLERLAGLGADWALPAHGEPISAPTALFRSYITERETRERDVLAALTDIGVGGGTAENLVTLAYPDVPVHTRPIGLLSLRSHLEKLLREGRVVENDGVYRSCG
jgi:glyoxylase-like metal-dependent hydrolase (beta-lactamase superfamily II)